MKGLWEKSVLSIVFEPKTGGPVKYALLTHDEVHSIEGINIVKMLDLRDDLVNHISTINYCDLITDRYQYLPHAVVISYVCDRLFKADVVDPHIL